MSETDLALLASGRSPDLSASRVAELAADIYRSGRERLASLLTQATFLAWLDEGLGLDTEISRASARNPFSQESSALDAFRLSQPDERPQPPTKTPAALLALMVRDVRDAGAGFPILKGGSGALRHVLGVSDPRDGWGMWADRNGKQSVDRGHFGGTLAFTPSLLYICVGVSVAIVLSNFVYQLAFSLHTQGLIFYVTAQLRFFSLIFRSMVIAALDLSACLDPVLLSRAQSVGLDGFVRQLADWPALVSAVERADSLSANLTAAALRGEAADWAGNSSRSRSSALMGLLVHVLLSVANREALLTLPIFGPSFGCVLDRLGSTEVQTLVNYTAALVTAETSRTRILLPKATVDSCRQVHLPQLAHPSHHPPLPPSPLLAPSFNLSLH